MTVDAASADFACGTDAILALAAPGEAQRLFLHVLVSDRCNHACQHCYQEHGQQGELSFDALADVLRAFRAGGGFVVEFSGGEATLRPDLIELLELARSLGLATVLYTNGYTMTAELAQRISNANVWRVEISLYSHNANEHDMVTMVPGSWHRTVQGIENLRRLGVVVQMKVPLLSTCTSSLADLEGLAGRLGCELTIADQLTDREGGNAAPLALKMDAARAAELTAPSAPQTYAEASVGASSCGAGKYGFTLRADGVLQPCTSLFVPLGRIDEARAPAGIAMGSGAAELFGNLTWNQLHGCRDCAIQGYCTRCHASALAETGDMFGPYPGACQLAAARYNAASGTGHENSAALGTTGPFERDSDGRLMTKSDEITDADHALRAEFPFVRREQPALVQIRKKAPEAPLDGARTH